MSTYHFKIERIGNFPMRSPQSLQVPTPTLESHRSLRYLQGSLYDRGNLERQAPSRRQAFSCYGFIAGTHLPDEPFFIAYIAIVILAPKSIIATPKERPIL